MWDTSAIFKNSTQSKQSPNIFDCKTVSKYTPIGIFGLKICHLATLRPTGENSPNLVTLPSLTAPTVFF
jgi:hypothetical protein